MTILPSLPAGELGELLIRGPQAMTGYLNRPDATAETIRDDGWLCTGDVAYADAEGQTWIAYEEPEEMFDDLDIDDDAPFVEKMEDALEKLTKAASGM